MLYPYQQPPSPPSVYERFHQVVAARRAEPLPKRVKFTAPAVELPEEIPQDLPCEELDEQQLMLSYGICLAGGACDSEDDPNALCAVCAAWSSNILYKVPGIPQIEVGGSIVWDQDFEAPRWSGYCPDWFDLFVDAGLEELHTFVTPKVDEEYAVLATLRELQLAKHFPLGIAEVVRYKRPGFSQVFFKHVFKEGRIRGKVFPEKIPGLWESPKAKEERRQRFFRQQSFAHRAFVKRWEQQQIAQDPDYLLLQKWRVRWSDYNWSKSANPHPVPLEIWPVAQREFAFDDWLQVNPPYIGWEGEDRCSWESPYRENFRFNLGWAKFEPGCPTCPKTDLAVDRIVFIFFNGEEDKWRIPKPEEVNHMFGSCGSVEIVFSPVKDKKAFARNVAAFWMKVEQATFSQEGAVRVLLPRPVFEFKFKQVRRHLPGKPCR